MICPGCGKELPEGARFCDNCGTNLSGAARPASPIPPISTPAAPAYSAPPYAPPAPETVSPAPKKKNRWILPLILGLVLAAAAAVFLLWFLGDGRAYRQAQTLYEQGQYAQAETSFRALGDYKDSGARVDDCRYQQARTALEKGNYTLALAKFEALGDYSDSAEQVKACRYQLARQAYDKGDLSGAAELFEALGGYADSADWLAKCRPATPAGSWRGQVNLADVGGEQLGELAAYLEDANVDFLLELREDNTFTMSIDASALMPTLKEAFLSYLNDMLTEMGVSAEDFEAITGQSLDDLIDSALAELDVDELNQSASGTYTESGGSITLFSDNNTFRGTWEGDTLFLQADKLGDIRFTRR